MPDDPKPEDAPKPEPPPEPEPDPKNDDEPFDKDRALETIRKQRESEAAAIKHSKELAAKLKEHEDSKLSDQEKLGQRAEGAEKEATTAKQEAARLRVALKKGLTESQARRLIGEDEEALEQDADELLESFAKGDDNDDAPRRPRERLRPGAAPAAEPDESDPAKLAEEVGRGW